QSGMTSFWPDFVDTISMARLPGVGGEPFLRADTSPTPKSVTRRKTRADLRSTPGRTPLSRSVAAAGPPCSGRGRSRRVAMGDTVGLPVWMLRPPLIATMDGAILRGSQRRAPDAGENALDGGRKQGAKKPPHGSEESAMNATASNGES